MNTHPDTQGRARPPADGLEWALVLMLFYNVVFVSPFIFKIFFWSLNYPIRLAIYGLVILMVLRYRRAPPNLRPILAEPSLFLFWITYFGYMVIVTVSSALGYKVYTSRITGELFDPTPYLVGIWLLTVFAAVMTAYLDFDLARWIMDRLTDLLVVCSIGAIVLTPILYNGWMEPISTPSLWGDSVQFDSDTVGRARFFGLGFHRDWATIAGMRLPRAQSFCQEGAGFAFFLLTAMIWAVRRQRFWALAIMATAFVLTWSIGPALFCLVIPLLYLMRWPVSVGLGILGALVVFNVLVGLGVLHGGLADGYMQEKLNGSDSSLGGRITDFQNLMPMVLDQQWLGFGAGSNGFVLPSSITTSVIAPLAQGGIPGMVLWLLAYGILGVHAVRLAIGQDPDRRAFGLMLLSVFCFSLQAPGLDADLRAWFIVGMVMTLVSQRPPAVQPVFRVSPRAPVNV